MAVQWDTAFDHAFSAACMGRSITYTRGGDSVTLSAVRSEYDADTEDLDDVRYVRRVTQWQIKASDLVLLAAEITPASGDTITDPDGVVHDYVSHARDDLAQIWTVTT